MQQGRVIAIYITPVAASPLHRVESTRAIPGRGLEGDRYCLAVAFSEGAWEPRREATLIEIEAIEALKRDKGIELQPHETRRNIITRGVALNHLVGREFSVGQVRMRGIKLCEPCAHLEKLTRKGVCAGLIHRGGLRAQILTPGIIQTGDVIAVDDLAPEEGDELGVAFEPQPALATSTAAPTVASAALPETWE